MKIGNFIVNRKIILTMALIVLVISSIVGYSYINSDLNYNADINISKYSCSQSNLSDRISCIASPDSVKSKFVDNASGIDFSQISSDTNGKGIYILSNTLGD